MSVAAAIPAEARGLTIVRRFEAPRVLVFRCWIDPVHMAAWWAPRPYTMPRLGLDPRPGGRIEAVMRSPEGEDHAFDGEFRVVEEPARLEFDTRIRDGDGVLFENAHVVTFEEDGDGTVVTLNITVVEAKLEAIRHLSGMSEGWNICLDQLQDLIRSGPAS